MLRIAERHPDRTIFTRFIPPSDPDHAVGAWRDYYERWRSNDTRPHRPAPGGETDVCVLATVIAAVDLGFRVVLPQDALCSVSDATHDALMTLYRERYSQQIETTSTERVLGDWD